MAGKFSALKREHVVQAIEGIGTIPGKFKSTKYEVVFEGKTFPPKYVLSMAMKIATGSRLNPATFYGGAQTNTVFQNLGFEIKQKNKLSVARLALRGVLDNYPDKFLVVTRFLNSIPTNSDVVVAITPGGFLCEEINRGFDGGTSWHSTGQGFNEIVGVASPIVNKFVERLMQGGYSRPFLLTIGIDLRFNNNKEAELVAVVDLDRGKVLKWTGKSYPTASQERRLIQVNRLESHCLRYKNRRILVLGCNDLNVYNGRGFANQNRNGPRRRRCDAFRMVIRTFKPEIVIQHPHMTDTARTWCGPWARLTRSLPSVSVWTSAIVHCHPRGERRRQELDLVLASTRSNGVFDIII